ncbi:hypothetical protein EYF80_057438 [Liparis tanakae]|uniref:Uncharacterized protein n=1 Tax=Liparis tanakae TaxID=230148 RepID=A0A4Z2EVZ1_9TELE|nr:hypothetical protein EYF80_057438 [Liparis tanakae]
MEMVWKRDLMRIEGPPPLALLAVGVLTGYHFSTNWRPVTPATGMLTRPTCTVRLLVAGRPPKSKCSPQNSPSCRALLPVRAYSTSSRHSSQKYFLLGGRSLASMIHRRSRVRHLKGEEEEEESTCPLTEEERRRGGKKNKNEEETKKTRKENKKEKKEEQEEEEQEQKEELLTSKQKSCPRMLLCSGLISTSSSRLRSRASSALPGLSRDSWEEASFSWGRPRDLGGGGGAREEVKENTRDAAPPRGALRFCGERRSARWHAFKIKAHATTERTDECTCSDITSTNRNTAPVVTSHPPIGTQHL